MMKLFNLKYFKNFVFILFILFVFVGVFINLPNKKNDNTQSQHSQQTQPKPQPKEVKSKVSSPEQSKKSTAKTQTVNASKQVDKVTSKKPSSDNNLQIKNIVKITQSSDNSIENTDLINKVSDPSIFEKTNQNNNESIGIVTPPLTLNNKQIEINPVIEFQNQQDKNVANNVKITENIQQAKSSLHTNSNNSNVNHLNVEQISSNSHAYNSNYLFRSLFQPKQEFLESAPRLLKGINAVTKKNRIAKANFEQFANDYARFIRKKFQKLFESQKISRRWFHKFIKLKIQSINKFLILEQKIFSQHSNAKFNERKNWIFNSKALKKALIMNRNRSIKTLKTQSAGLRRVVSEQTSASSN